MGYFQKWNVTGLMLYFSECRVNLNDGNGHVGANGFSWNQPSTCNRPYLNQHLYIPWHKVERFPIPYFEHLFMLFVGYFFVFGDVGAGRNLHLGMCCMCYVLLSFWVSWEQAAAPPSSNIAVTCNVILYTFLILTECRRTNGKCFQLWKKKPWYLIWFWG